jgi:hypothetical protein
MFSNNPWTSDELVKLERAIVEGSDRYEIYSLFPTKPKDTVGIKMLWTKKAMGKGDWKWLKRESRQKYQQLMTDQDTLENAPTSSGGNRPIRRDRLIGPGPVKIIDGEKAYIVEEIISAFERNGEKFFEIKWKGYGHEHNTEEPEDNIWDDVPEIVRAFYDSDEIDECDNIEEPEGIEDSDDLEMSDLESSSDHEQGSPSVTRTMGTSAPAPSTALEQLVQVEMSLFLEQSPTQVDLDILFEQFLGQQDQQNTFEAELDLLQALGRISPDDLERERAPHYRSLGMDWNQELTQGYFSFANAGADNKAPGSLHYPGYPAQKDGKLKNALLFDEFMGANQMDIDEL